MKAVLKLVVRTLEFSLSRSLALSAFHCRWHSEDPLQSFNSMKRKKSIFRLQMICKDHNFIFCCFSCWNATKMSHRQTCRTRMQLFPVRWPAGLWWTQTLSSDSLERGLRVLRHCHSVSQLSLGSYREKHHSENSDWHQQVPPSPDEYSLPSGLSASPSWSATLGGNYLAEVWSTLWSLSSRQAE